MDGYILVAINKGNTPLADAGEQNSPSPHLHIWLQKLRKSNITHYDAALLINTHRSIHKFFPNTWANGILICEINEERRMAGAC